MVRNHVLFSNLCQCNRPNSNLLGRFSSFELDKHGIRRRWPECGHPAAAQQLPFPGLNPGLPKSFRKCTAMRVWCHRERHLCPCSPGCSGHCLVNTGFLDQCNAQQALLQSFCPFLMVSIDPLLSGQPLLTLLLPWHAAKVSCDRPAKVSLKKTKNQMAV